MVICLAPPAISMAKGMLRSGTLQAEVWPLHTIPLQGRMDRSRPLHWSANFDEVQDFEHDIRNGMEDWASTTAALAIP